MAFIGTGHVEIQVRRPLPTTEMSRHRFGKMRASQRTACKPSQSLNNIVHIYNQLTALLHVQGSILCLLTSVDVTTRWLSVLNIKLLTTECGARYSWRLCGFVLCSSAKLVGIYVTQSEKTDLIAHVSRFDFSPRTHSYMNELSNSTFKIS